MKRHMVHIRQPNPLTTGARLIAAELLLVLLVVVLILTL